MNASYPDLVLPRPGRLQRLLKHPALMHYHRLVALVALLNLLQLYAMLRSGSTPALAQLLDLVLVNMSVAILMRQQYVVNFLFWLATRAPLHWPLAIRWHLGKVYHFGGLHSASAVAATAWYLVFVGTLMAQRARGTSVLLLLLACLLLGTLMAMIAMALPRFRARRHNSFELMHRLGGWSALLLFWAQTLVFIGNQRGSLTLGSAIVRAPAFWMLLLLTGSIVLPWLRLRKVPIEVHKPSGHAVIIGLQHTTPFAGSSTALSLNPLREWHSFANIPSPGSPGFRLIISRAGDWTGSFIETPPSHVWVKGITTAGVAHIETLFRKVVYVATGSGIGPVMPHLLAQNVPIHLIWSTRSPRKTYGDALIDEILRVQPDALIWDTDERGKPDLVELAYRACQHFEAEAVICISNQKLTTQVVYAMECRGIPAYGAIWDS